MLKYFAGVKVGLPLLLREGPELLREVARVAGRLGTLRIADLKLADIGDVMASSLELVSGLGYDAVIGHAFVGLRGGLDILASKASELGVKLILVVSMSHEGSREFYDKHFTEFLSLAKEVGAWGVVVPATRPHLIAEARALLEGSARILSPGVGTQGASYGTAICYGADYEIVGRSVVRAADPLEAARRIVEEVRKVMGHCRGSYA